MIINKNINKNNSENNLDLSFINFKRSDKNVSLNKNILQEKTNVTFDNNNVGGI